MTTRMIEARTTMMVAVKGTMYSQYKNIKRCLQTRMDSIFFVDLREKSKCLTIF